MLHRREDHHQRIYLECECSNKSHLVAVEWAEWDEYEHVMTIYAQMSPTVGFWRRLWYGIRYAFNGQACRYGDWCACLVRLEDARSLRGMLTKFIEEQDGEIRK